MVCTMIALNPPIINRPIVRIWTIFLLWSNDAPISTSGCQCRSLKHTKATEVLLVISTARVIIRSVVAFERYNCDLWLGITIEAKEIRCCLLVSSPEQTIMNTHRISSVWKATVSYFKNSIGNFTELYRYLYSMI